MKAAIQITLETEVGQQVQEIASWGTDILDTPTLTG